MAKKRDENRYIPGAESSPPSIGLRRVISEAKSQTPALICGTLCLFLASGASLYIPFLFGSILDGLGSQSQDQEQEADADSVAEFRRDIVGLLIASVVNAAFTFLKSVCFAFAGERLVASLRRRLFAQLLRHEIGFYDQSRAAELTARLGGDTTVIQQAATSNIASAARHLVTAVGGVVYLITVSWKLGLLVLCVVPPVGVISRVYGRAIKARTKAARQSAAEASEVAEESLANIRTLRALPQGEAMQEAAYGAKISAAMDIGFKASIADGLFSGGTSAAMYAAFTAIVFFGGSLVLSGELSRGQLTSFLLYSMTIGSALSGLAGAFGSLSAALGASERVYQLLDRLPLVPRDEGELVGDPLPEANKGTGIAGGSSSSRVDEEGEGEGVALTVKVASDIARAVGAGAGAGAEDESAALDAASGRAAGPHSGLRGEIEFSAVRFTYPARPGQEVLRGLSFRIPHGTRAALVGESGGGKSTVLSLIEKFYLPSSGAVLVDGRDVRTLSGSSLRRHIGLVQQDPVLMACSVADNIRMGRPAASLAEVQAAARAANAHDFISGFPQGYDTIVGERGQRCSGGQRQRIAIARALLQDPRILLLDEASSALDANAEAAVQDALARLMAGRTVLIVAHRLSTVRDADIIFVLSKGTVVASGSHDDLLRSSTLYAELVKRQLHAASTLRPLSPESETPDATSVAVSSATLDVA